MTSGRYVCISLKGVPKQDSDTFGLSIVESVCAFQLPKSGRHNQPQYNSRLNEFIFTVSLGYNYVH